MSSTSRWASSSMYLKFLGGLRGLGRPAKCQYCSIAAVSFTSASTSPFAFARLFFVFMFSYLQNMQEIIDRDCECPDGNPDASISGHAFLPGSTGIGDPPVAQDLALLVGRRSGFVTFPAIGFEVQRPRR